MDSCHVLNGLFLTRRRPSSFNQWSVPRAGARVGLGDALGPQQGLLERLDRASIEVGQTTVAKYMAKRRRPPSQGWKTFLHNHADAIASMDMFVVPTISFRLLYGLLVLGHSRREFLWVGVTAHPNAEWLARQLTEACG
jgi:hypothetical protein